MPREWPPSLGGVCVPALLDLVDPASVPPADLTLTLEQVRLELVAAAGHKVAIQSSSHLEQ